MSPIRLITRLVLVPLVAVTAACAGNPSAGATATAAVFPGDTWDSIPDPRAAGWSAAGLDSVRADLSTMASTGFLAIVGGRVLFRYGNVDTVTYLASVRKSILSLLMGNYVRRGIVDLDRTLADLNMDDLQGLSAGEKQATVWNLLTARSGIYHPASNAGDDTRFAPPRGSQQPGGYFLYNNWDFNALGGAFERMTGRDIYDVLEVDLARPIGMQDFHRDLHRKTGDPSRSRYLAYHIHLSTRDMARVGYLMLRRGRWNGREIVPADWVEESTRPFTPVETMNPPQRRQGPFGYGYLWWVWDGPHATGLFRGAYAAHGAIGQHIVVLPALDLVIAHKTSPGQRDSTGAPRSVSHPRFLQVVNLLVRAHCGTSCP